MDSLTRADAHHHTNKRRRGPSQADLARTIRVAQQFGLHVEIERADGTIVRLRPGEPAEAPNARGLTVVP
jgi:hypothetical protein